MDLKVRKPGIVDLFRSIFSIDQSLDGVIDASAKELVVPKIGKENVDSSGPAVHGDQVLQVNGLLRELRFECLQDCMGGVDVWHEQSRFLGHTGDNVLHVSETEDVLNFRDLTDLVG